jgi:hypothetical protein
LRRTEREKSIDVFALTLLVAERKPAVAAFFLLDFAADRLVVAMFSV